MILSASTTGACTGGSGAVAPIASLRRASLLVSLAALGTLLFAAASARATPVTLSVDQLLTAADATTAFGGNGAILDRSEDSGGILFEIQTSSIDFGKVALRYLVDDSVDDLSAFDSFGLHFDVVALTNSIVVTSYVQRSGAPFVEAVSGDLGQGASVDIVVPMTGPGFDNVAYLGFQVFAAGGLEEPPAQDLLLRISPLSGAEFVPVPIPEPSTAPLLTAGLVLVARARRRAARRGYRTGRREDGG